MALDDTGRPFKNVYQFKITLRGIRPPIWRRIQVPEHCTFWDLHVAIQDALGWLDYHLHAFHVVNPKTGVKEEIGIPDEDYAWEVHEILPGWELPVSRYFTAENNKCLYIYDFGDDWHHDIKLEKILPRDSAVKYPLCVAGKRACPPEDCGGVWGYANLLEILADPGHDEYEETLTWVGEDFDPDRFEIGEIAFTDPKKRWEYAFSHEEDFIDDEFMDDEDEGEDREEIGALSRDFMHRLWQRAKGGDLEGLSSEEKRLGEIMLDHEDEFHNEFEFADVTHDRGYDVDTEVNPFLHIYIHSIAENQLAEKDPIEVFQFYNGMRKKRCSHHETIHMIGAILAPLLFSVLKYQGTFDLTTYRELLKKYKARNPAKIFELLEKEPRLYPPED